MMRPLPELNIEELCKMGIYVTQKTVKDICLRVIRNPERSFEIIFVGKKKKKALRIDCYAEDTACKLMEERMEKWQKGHFKKLTYFGEESLGEDPFLADCQTVCVLADAIDGTDLLERGLYNWCSAFIFFYPARPHGQKILAAFVGLPTGEVYHARCDKEGAFVSRGSEKAVPVSGPSEVKAVHQASICFYGQKVKNMRATFESGFLGGLEQAILGKSDDETTLRLYDLAGIPMMMKLIDHKVKTACGIDVVFDIAGQKPHDVVPGAFIAKKAGAVLKNLKGDDISDNDLETLLLKPSAAENELKYVLAATHELGNSVINLLSAKTHTKV